jgi:chromosomal replication initiation ATPase DnaA
MTVDEVVDALALMTEEEGIGCLIASCKQREAARRAERRAQRVAGEAEQSRLGQAGVVVDVVCCVYGIEEAELRGLGRGSEIWEARSVAYLLMLDLLDMLPRQVAEEMRRDRSTVAKVASKARRLTTRRSMLARSLVVDALTGASA